MVGFFELCVEICVGFDVAVVQFFGLALEINFYLLEHNPEISIINYLESNIHLLEATKNYTELGLRSKRDEWAKVGYKTMRIRLKIANIKLVANELFS